MLFSKSDGSCRKEAFCRLLTSSLDSFFCVSIIWRRRACSLLNSCIVGAGPVGIGVGVGAGAVVVVVVMVVGFLASDDIWGTGLAQQAQTRLGALGDTGFWCRQRLRTTFATAARGTLLV